eukprot:6470168-Amphidinium_carterae.1
MIKTTTVSSEQEYIDALASVTVACFDAARFQLSGTSVRGWNWGLEVLPFNLPRAVPSHDCPFCVGHEGNSTDPALWVDEHGNMRTDELQPGKHAVACCYYLVVSPSPSAFNPIC